MPISRWADSLLEWYFSGGAAQCLGGSSNWAHVIGRAELYHVDGGRKFCRDEVTAWPAKSPKREPSWTPNEDTLSRLGHAARELRRVQERDPFALEILTVLYSDEAARWARSPWGRVAALIRLTPTGRKLIAKARAKQRGPKLALTNAQLAENIVQGPTPDYTRTVLLAKAMKEARALEEYAAQVWAGTDVEATCEAAE